MIFLTPASILKEICPWTRQRPVGQVRVRGQSTGRKFPVCNRLARVHYVPNRYVQFGDFDLAGVHIFLTEFHVHLGARSSFLIPEDIEARLSHGSRKRYDNQYPRFHQLRCDTPDLQQLIDLINKYHRCYDQEGYITY